MSRWIVALMISAAGLAAGTESARAGSLAEVISALLNPNANPPAQGHKPTERSAERTQAHIVKRPRIRHPHAGKPPTVSVTGHTPIERGAPPSAPPVSTKMPAPEPVLVSPSLDPLQPRPVQTLTVSPSTTPPVAAPAEPKEAARPAVRIGHEELPQLAATVTADEKEAPVAPDSSGPAGPLRYGAILFDLLLLALVAGALVSINARTPARLPVLLRPSLRGRLRPLLAGIDRQSWVRRFIQWSGLAKPRSTGHANAPSGPALSAAWDVNWGLTTAPSGTPLAGPATRSNKDEGTQHGRTLPELEDQLARIVQDQIVVPLRKAS